MKIFVTVGTTKFDSLVAAIDEKLKNSNYDIVLQISDGKYLPKNFEYFDYTNSIQKYFEESDIVITHAGAGSIYELLELGKKIIIVPNLDRIDKHQTDIANYMDSNLYAKTLSSFDELLETIEYVRTQDFKKFKKESFFMTKEILDFIES